MPAMMLDPNAAPVFLPTLDGPAVEWRVESGRTDYSQAVAFMEELTRKLESYNLDLVEPGDPHGDEPTYRLRR